MGLFEGIKVLDFTNNAAGPVCVTMLADFGADVIKVERPVVGDDIRGFAPKLDNVGLNFLFYNRGKKSITIALDDPEGIEIIKKIIPDMDVVVESFRPGVMKKFNLDYESIKEIKPDIIYCSISAYGQTGPYSKKPGYDLIAQALCGVMDMTGEPDAPPQKSGFILGDYVGAMNAYGAIASALYYRQVSGKGQHIDYALLDGMVAMNNFVELAYTGVSQSRIGAHHSAICPYGVYSGKKGQCVTICAPNNKLWTQLTALIGQEELGMDERFATGPARIKNLKMVIEILETWLQGFDNIEDAVAILDQGGIPCAKVKTAKDLLGDEHLIARGMITEIDTPPSVTKFDKLKTRGVWIHMSETPGSISRAPDLGEHNYEILQQYGLSREKISELQGRWKNN